MADVYTVYRKCTICGGTGTIKVTEETVNPEDPQTGVIDGSCPKCEGEGELEWGRMTEV